MNNAESVTSGGSGTSGGVADRTVNCVADRAVNVAEFRAVNDPSGRRIADRSADGDTILARWKFAWIRVRQDAWRNALSRGTFCPSTISAALKIIEK